VSWWFLDRMWLSEKKNRMDPTCQVYMFWLWLANYVTCSAPFLYPRSCASLNLLKIMLYFPMGNPLLGESIVNSDIFLGFLKKIQVLTIGLQPWVEPWAKLCALRGVTC
jgi:hypothetical protein